MQKGQIFPNVPSLYLKCSQLSYTVPNFQTFRHILAQQNGI